MNNVPQQSCLLLFAKYPEPGRVKTRLASSLGENITVELYRCFIQDILETMKGLQAPLHLCVYPENSENKFRRWLGESYRYFPQKGKDLGERMQQAFEQVFTEGYKKAIIIGSDSPDLPASLLENAFAALDANDAVIGPAVDGGYYLIGFNRQAFLREVFEGISWSTAEVFPVSLRILTAAGRQVRIMPPWRDVDTITDLKELIIKNKNTDFHESKTAIYLSKHAELLN